MNGSLQTKIMNYTLAWTTFSEINMVHLTLRSLRARRKRPLSASVTTPSPARLKVSKKENKVIILPITCPVYLWSRKNVCTYPLLLNLAWINSVQQSKEEKSASPKKRLGLKNLGNTCFMNSVSIRYPKVTMGIWLKSQVLQSLSNIEEFSKVIKTLPSLDERQVSSTVSICILPTKQITGEKE